MSSYPLSYRVTWGSSFSAGGPMGGAVTTVVTFTPPTMGSFYQIIFA